jgi:hypothetical protein
MAPMEAMTDTWSWRLFWRAADQRDYLVTLVRLHILDALAGPLPETCPLPTSWSGHSCPV